MKMSILFVPLIAVAHFSNSAGSVIHRAVDAHTGRCWPHCKLPGSHTNVRSFHEKGVDQFVVHHYYAGRQNEGDRENFSRKRKAAASNASQLNVATIKYSIMLDPKQLVPASDILSGSLNLFHISMWLRKKTMQQYLKCSASFSL